MFRVLLWGSALSLFLFSNSLLNELGVGYMSAQGSALGKLHPSLWLSAPTATLVALRLVRVDRPIPLGVSGSWRPMLVIGLAAALTSATLSRDGGGNVSAALVTFVGPALLAFLLQHATPRDLRGMRLFLAAFFVANSLVGLAEAATSWRLLPFYVADEVITFDTRPTAILGHPLTNALLTGVMLLALLIRQLASGLRVVAIGLMALHLAALFAFGGRAALFLTLAIAGLILLRALATSSALQRPRAVVLASCGVTALATLFALGLADPLLDRLASAVDSTNTRYAALRLPAMLSLKEWLIGAEPAARAAYQSVLDMPYGIEIAPIAMVLAYGLPLTLLLLVATCQLLLRWSHNSVPGTRYLVLYFALAVTTSLSIGSKSLLLSQMLVILFTLHPVASLQAQPQIAAHRPLRTGRILFH